MTTPHTLTFKGVVEGYVTNFLSKNFWRVQGTMEWCDVMQEARLIFWDVSQRYPDVEDKHLMALFKTSWYHHFADLSNADTRQRHVVPFTSLVVDDEADEVPQQEAVGTLENEGFFSIMVEQAPREVKMVLSLLLNAPQELLDVAVGAWSNRGRSRAASVSRINRCLGLPPDFDSIAAVEDYFTTAE